jgi:sugar phosphate isomerase/epimerase
MQTTISRRALLAGAGLAAAASAADSPAKLKVAVFSKHLSFVNGENLAKAAHDLGFDAVDLTVRKGGHVEPERVRQSLPPLVATLRRAGLEVPMVTTDIVDAETPYAEDILKTMADLGIPRYRWMPSGGLKYAAGAPYKAQLEGFRPRIAKLADLNGRYKVGAMFHTHSGVNFVGTSIWDLRILFEGLDPQCVGVNYDIGHATVEGGLGGWINSFRVITPFLSGIAVKDFVWANGAKGWQPKWVPLGEGMVHFPQFFAMVKEAGFNGPLQMHFEYPLTTPEETYTAMKRDLGKLRGYLNQAAL